jgi:arginine/lysine/ornithine decarboxylase
MDSEKSTYSVLCVMNSTKVQCVVWKNSHKRTVCGVYGTAIKVQCVVCVVCERHKITLCGRATHKSTVCGVLEAAKKYSVWCVRGSKKVQCVVC